MNFPAAIPLAVGHRSLAEGTGVSTYGRMLLAAAGGLHDAPWRVDTLPPGLDGSAWRRLAALWPGSRRLLPNDGRGLVAPDVYRRAQVHFDLYGRLLALRPPWARGIVHWAYPLPLKIAGWINIYTVHDAIPLLRPDLTPIDGRRHRRLLAAIGQAADAIVTVSEAARGDLSALDLPFGEIANCGCAVDAPPTASIRTEEAGRYFLVCGSIERRKNIERVVRAHARSGVEIPLHVVGPDGWGADGIRRSLEGMANVTWLPFQRRDALLAMIGGARALLMPSLAEGFGLPLVEAMALGTPVLASAAGALAETAGDAALLADAEDEDALAKAIGMLATDDALVDSLVERGLRRSGDFTLSRFSSRLAGVYAAAIERRGWAA